MNERDSKRRIRGTTRPLEEAARALRQQLTPAEAQLWSALRGRQVGGLRFRCQHPVGPYALDFYCPSLKLVVEVDGGIHAQQREQDAARTEHLQAYGYHILRFTNEQVLADLDSVRATILRIATALIERQRAPSTQPTQGEAPHPS